MVLGSLGTIGFNEVIRTYHIFLKLSPTFVQVVARWEKFLSKTKPKGGKQGVVADIPTHFPFHKYFENAPQPVFKGQAFEQDMDIAEVTQTSTGMIFL